MSRGSQRQAGGGESSDGVVATDVELDARLHLFLAIQLAALCVDKEGDDVQLLDSFLWLGDVSDHEDDDIATTAELGEDQIERDGAWVKKWRG